MKTIRILLNLICVFIVGISVNAQECNTPSPAPPAWLFNPVLQSQAILPEIYTLRIFVHIVRSSSGSGLGAGIVSTMVSKLNSDYANTGIQFQSMGNDFIDTTLSIMILAHLNMWHCM